MLLLMFDWLPLAFFAILVLSSLDTCSFHIPSSIQELVSVTLQVSLILLFGNIVFPGNKKVNRAKRVAAETDRIRGNINTSQQIEYWDIHTFSPSTKRCQCDLKVVTHTERHRISLFMITVTLGRYKSLKIH